MTSTSTSCAEATSRLAGEGVGEDARASAGGGSSSTIREKRSSPVVSTVYAAKRPLGDGANAETPRTLPKYITPGLNSDGSNAGAELASKKASGSPPSVSSTRRRKCIGCGPCVASTRFEYSQPPVSAPRCHSNPEGAALGGRVSNEPTRATASLYPLMLCSTASAYAFSACRCVSVSGLSRLRRWKSSSCRTLGGSSRRASSLPLSAPGSAPNTTGTPGTMRGGSGATCAVVSRASSKQHPNIIARCNVRMQYNTLQEVSL